MYVPLSITKQYISDESLSIIFSLPIFALMFYSIPEDPSYKGTPINALFVLVAS